VISFLLYGFLSDPYIFLFSLFCTELKKSMSLSPPSLTEARSHKENRLLFGWPLLFVDIIIARRDFYFPSQISFLSRGSRSVASPLPDLGVKEKELEAQVLFTLPPTPMVDLVEDPLFPEIVLSLQRDRRGQFPLPFLERARGSVAISPLPSKSPPSSPIG